MSHMYLYLDLIRSVMFCRSWSAPGPPAFLSEGFDDATDECTLVIDMCEVARTELLEDSDGTLIIQLLESLQSPVIELIVLEYTLWRKKIVYIQCYSLLFTSFFSYSDKTLVLSSAQFHLISVEHITFTYALRVL